MSDFEEVFESLFEKHHANENVKYGVGATLRHHKEFIFNFIKDNSDSFNKVEVGDDDDLFIDDDKIIDLLIHTSNYTMAIETKKTPAFIRRLFYQQEKETALIAEKGLPHIIARNNARVIKIIEDFEQLPLSEDGVSLLRHLRGFLEDPSRYIFDESSLKFNANNTELRAYLRSLGLFPKEITAYVEHFKPAKPL